MDAAALVAVLDREGRAIAAIVDATALERPVPTCPGWDLGKLARHLGRVHRWAREAVATADPSRPPQRPMPPGEGAAAVRAYLRDGVGPLVEALRAAPPSRPAWSFVGPRTAAWWARRQALETAVHRVDAALSASVPVEPLAADVAGLGIEELGEVFLGGVAPAATPGGAPQTLHVHATDAECEWTFRLGAEGVTAEPGHRRGDAAARGAAADLLLLLCGRPTAGAVEVLGDAAVLAQWRERVRI